MGQRPDLVRIAKGAAASARLGFTALGAADSQHRTVAEDETMIVGLSSPRLIGRDAEIEMLVRLAGEAEAGRPTVGSHPRGSRCREDPTGARGDASRRRTRDARPARRVHPAFRGRVPVRPDCVLSARYRTRGSHAGAGRAARSGREQARAGETIALDQL